MTTITAQVLADSVSPAGERLTTMQLRYPRCIHAEFMTHRQFSRNASSSRAIPVGRLIADVRADPFILLHWGRNRPGMQADEELTGKTRAAAEIYWRSALASALHHAEMLSLVGAHKQLVNRVLEPFSHINVVVTATEWSNFFALRCHKDAEPHIQVLANQMKRALEDSTPDWVDVGMYHVPYITVVRGLADGARLYFADEACTQSVDVHTAIRLSIARCARVSYLTHDRVEPTLEQDLALSDRLLRSDPLHASPMEHQATPDGFTPAAGRHNPQWGNFTGWLQFRKQLKGECQ